MNQELTFAADAGLRLHSEPYTRSLQKQVRLDDTAATEH